MTCVAYDERIVRQYCPADFESCQRFDIVKSDAYRLIVYQDSVPTKLVDRDSGSLHIFLLIIAVKTAFKREVGFVVDLPIGFSQRCADSGGFAAERILSLAVSLSDHCRDARFDDSGFLICNLRESLSEKLCVVF